MHDTMPDGLSALIERLSIAVASMVHASTITAGAMLYSVTIPVDLVPSSIIPRLPSPYLIWGHPDRNHYRIGVGMALQWQSRGHARFVELQHYFDALCHHWQHCSGVTAYQPGAFCAFAFDEEDPMAAPWQGFANTQLTIPALLLEYHAGRYTLTLSCRPQQIDQPTQRQRQLQQWFQQMRLLLGAMVQPEPDAVVPQTLYRLPDREGCIAWTDRVARAKSEIRHQQLTKVVVARHLQLQGRVPFDAAAILTRLAIDYPSCLLLGVGVGEKSVLAATPERLITLHNGVISCDALGGTAACSPNPLQQQRLSQALLTSPKTRHEHQLVVDHLHQCLTPVCDALEIPLRPSLLTLGALQHLWSPIQAQCRSGVSLIELAATLHPTPAVAGTPVLAAQQWLDECEPFKRGWYSGGVGWLQADGNGEVSVLLRTALIHGQRADLYAGAGVVADSDPQAEWRETELKLQAMLGVLGHSDSPRDSGKILRARS